MAHTAWHWMIDRGEILWKTDRPRHAGALLSRRSEPGGPAAPAPGGR